MNKPLWIPNKQTVTQCHMTGFRHYINKQHTTALEDYDSLYQWSIENLPQFWEAVWRFCNIKSSAPYSTVLENPVMPGATWFKDAKLNFAENLLRYRDNETAITYIAEGGQLSDSITYKELFNQVARLAHYFKELGVVTGDRIAGFMPNRIETVTAMLAATSLGAVWSSCSPDFGFKGAMERFGQIQPKILITTDGYFYNGKAVSSLSKVSKIEEETPSLEAVLLVPMLENKPNLTCLTNGLLWSDAFVQDGTPFTFKQLPFDHPIYIMYSSGTTGVPKCMVHGAGGTLLQHAKELLLHCDLKRTDTIFYFTTCGWMMWNWLVSSLMVGARIILYDGSPVYPDRDILWKIAEEFEISIFGTSAKYISLCMNAEISPGKKFDLSKLRTILSTGSPLAKEGFEWVYRHVKKNLQLASISGGTDLISCFALGDPTSPIYSGQIQKRGLGMKVESWSDAGQAVMGEKGELVCTAPFPSMPVRFLNDPENEKYRDAYFRRFPNVWWHGDYIEITEQGGMIVHGRSDATLNPGGVRIGTAEIYRPVETMPEVEDSLVVGQKWHDDERLILFVVIQQGLTLTAELAQKIRQKISNTTSPRHVPAKIIAVPEIPMTINGKKMEMAVRDIIEGKEIKNRAALANPTILDYFQNIGELQ